MQSQLAGTASIFVYVRLLESPRYIHCALVGLSNVKQFECFYHTKNLPYKTEGDPRLGVPVQFLFVVSRCGCCTSSSSESAKGAHRIGRCVHALYPTVPPNSSALIPRTGRWLSPFPHTVARDSSRVPSTLLQESRSCGSSVCVRAFYLPRDISFSMARRAARLVAAVDFSLSTSYAFCSRRCSISRATYRFCIASYPALATR